MGAQVEFLGLPDSGKTTFLQAIRGICRQHGINALSLDEGLYSCIKKDLHHRGNLGSASLSRQEGLVRSIAPLAIKSEYFRKSYFYSELAIGAYSEFVLANKELVGLILRVIGEGLADKREQLLVMRMLYSLFSGYQTVTNSLETNEILMMDEGFCHRAVTIWGRIDSRKEEPDLYEYLDLIPLPTVLVVTKLEPSACEERYDGKKKRGLLKGLKLDDRIAKLSRIDVMIQQILSNLKEKDVKIFTIDNSEENALRVPPEIIDAIIGPASERT